jgi:hypothetical protein
LHWEDSRNAFGRINGTSIENSLVQESNNRTIGMMATRFATQSKGRFCSNSSYKSSWAHWAVLKGVLGIFSRTQAMTRLNGLIVDTMPTNIWKMLIRSLDGNPIQRRQNPVLERDLLPLDFWELIRPGERSSNASGFTIKAVDSVQSCPKLVSQQNKMRPEYAHRVMRAKQSIILLPSHNFIEAFPTL